MPAAAAIAGNLAARFNSTSLPALVADLVNHEKAPLYASFAALLLVVLIASSSSSSSSSSSPSSATSKSGKPLPPHVPHSVPFLGNAVPYGVQPISFLRQCMDKFGDCFTFTMMGRKMTFCLDPDGNHFVFNVKLANATAEGAYDKLTVPVFGTEVVYDVPNNVFMEQKKFVKDALTTSAFKTYVPIIADEARALFATWPDSSESLELFPEMAELTIRTASHCLMGREIREQLHSNVAKLYHDLDSGFQPINVFFRWLPLPNYFARDRAHKTMTQTFLNILAARRAASAAAEAAYAADPSKPPPPPPQDVLQSLMDGVYRDGTKMSDEAVAHMMIALLMAGQHTSSTSTSWIIFELARDPATVAALLREQAEVLTGDPDTPPHLLPELTYDALRQCALLDRVMKESLRLHSPIHSVMRLVIQDVEYKGYTIPKGHFLCGSPSVSQYDPAKFPNPEKFDPSRWETPAAGEDGNVGEWNINGVDIAQKSARSSFLPFGAGRHRCIGEFFALKQIGAIISMFVREFEFKLAMDKKTGERPMAGSDFTSLIVMPVKGSAIEFRRRDTSRKTT
ncbi:Lanosterol 14-alpha-demethylase [Geranomyces michiganensis]|nr:Lanosterol 14-alpha-demethylase [Geranomyces michiganensis]